MKKQILSIMIVTGLFYGSCNDHQQQNNLEATRNKDRSVNAKKNTIDTTLTNTKGKTLQMSFDTAAHSAVFVFRGEQITLNQELQASGIKHSNEKYEYTEWHGARTLKKDGEVVFAHSK